MIKVSVIIKKSLYGEGNPSLNHQRQRQLTRILLITVVSVTLSLLSVNHLVYAQNTNGITLTARVGFTGNCKTDHWIPIQVTVENKGADINGRIQAAYTNGKGGDSIYGQEISLPSNSRKEVFLYLYPDGYLDKPNVNLTVNGQLITKTPLTIACIPEESLVIGLITDTPNAFSKLGALSAPNGYTRIAALRINNLPDRPEGWETLDGLVISAVDTGALTDAQRGALKGWLAQGGKLVIAGGPKWQNVASGLDEFLPLALNTTQTVSGLSSLQNYLKSPDSLDGKNAILAVGQTRANATVLVSEGNSPVLAHSQIGFGHVYYLAADPGVEPLSNWGGISNLYASLLAPTSNHPVWMTSTINTYSANQALSALPALGLPPTIYVLCLLGAYILVIGPINYVILRAIKRQEWAWFTIPAFVLLFTGVAYLSGYWIRGARPILNRLTVVQAWDGVELAQARSLVGIYSPGRTRYTLNAGNDFLSFPFDSNSQSLQSNQGWLSLQQGSDVLLPDVLVEASGMKSASFNGQLPALDIAQKLTLTLGSAGPSIKGTITNNSKYTIKSLRLKTTDNTIVLGDLKPGDNKNVQMSFRASPQDIQIFDFQGYSGYGTYYASSNAEDQEVRQNALMSAVLSGEQSYTASVGKVTAGMYLTGWVEEALLPISVQGQAFDTIDTTFYILNLTPTIVKQSDQQTLTAGMFLWSSSDPSITPYLPDYPSYSNTARENGYTLTFKLAFPLQYSNVKALNLILDQPTYASSGTSFQTTNTASLWNWETSAWDEMQNAVWGTNTIPNPALYVGPESEIRLKIGINNSNGPNQAIVGSSYFTLVVQP